MQRLVGLNIKPWCTCAATGLWARQDGYALDRPSKIWVHSRCRKPSKMNYDRHVLGLPQIPQPRKPEDIYEVERRYWAKQEIKKELDDLGWYEDADDWTVLIDE